jgi:hypothetical protein
VASADHVSNYSLTEAAQRYPANFCELLGLSATKAVSATFQFLVRHAALRCTEHILGTSRILEGLVTYRVAQFYNPSISRFMELKLYWGASMQALIYKAWQIGRLSDRMFKYYNIEMSTRGFRTKEPIEWNGSAESAATLRQLVATYVDELEYSTGDFGDLFGLMDDEVEALFPLPGKKKPQLKLVL